MAVFRLGVYPFFHAALPPADALFIYVYGILGRLI